MNDKIITQTPYTDFRKNSQFDNNFSYESSIKVVPNQEPKQLERWYCNKPLFNVDVNGFGTRVIFNPNKINGFKYKLDEPITFKQIETTFELIEDELHSIGIDTNLKQSKFIRNDNSFDLKTSGGYSIYEPLYKTLAPISKSIIRGRKRIEENTLYFGNNSKEISIYDKKKSIEDLENIIIDDNITRLETRNLKAKLQNIRFCNLDEDKYLRMRLKDKNLIRDYVFNKNPLVLEDEVYTFYACLISSDLSQAQIQKLLTQRMLQQWNYEGYEVESLHHATRKTHGDKKYRRNRELNKLLYQTIRIKDDLRGHYEELKQLFERVA